MLRPRLRYLILFLSLGLVASYVSVNVLTSYSYFPSGIAMNYGFPLPWETSTEALCGQNPPQPQAYPILNGPCLKPCCVTTYNLTFLLFDVLFYTGIGYLSLLSYHRLLRGIDSGLPNWSATNRQSPTNLQTERTTAKIGNRKASLTSVEVKF